MRLKRRKKSEPTTVRVTTGGGSCPMPVYEEKFHLGGGDVLTINLDDRAVVLTRGNYGTVPVRLKYRGRWYDIGAEILNP